MCLDKFVRAVFRTNDNDQNLRQYDQYWHPGPAPHMSSSKIKITYDDITGCVEIYMVADTSVRNLYIMDKAAPQLLCALKCLCSELDVALFEMK